MLDDMERRGIEEISYFQVDNGLAPAADPVFLGVHSLAGAEMSSKALLKREPEEPIGAFVRVGDTIVVREYSDLTREQARERIAGGPLLYGLGSIALHALRVDFVRREAQSGFKLPFHLAEKSSPFLDESGALVQPKEKNVYKFETFIFDALRDARRTVVLEVRREEEFSPLKNATGKDSPETCRRDLSALCASWLEQAGVRVPRDERGAPKHPVEISPLFALDAAELAGKVPRDLNVGGAILLAPPR
jgi:UDP-N-acetylglucosamine/UDP-N-acetylgalactosamine diphosphorylase